MPDIKMEDDDDGKELLQYLIQPAVLPTVFQTPEMLQPDTISGSLWRLPTPPIHFGKRKHLVINHGIKDHSTQKYHLYSLHLSRSWKNTTSPQWLPQTLQKTTPYSFALLRALHGLAKETSGKYEQAMDWLIEAWLERQTFNLDLDSQSSEQQQHLTPIPEAKKHKPKHKSKYRLHAHEVENPQGLMVQDVLGAIQLSHNQPYLIQKQAYERVSTANAEEMLGKLEDLDTSTFNNRERKVRRTEMDAARGMLGMDEADRKEANSAAVQQEREMKAGQRFGRRARELKEAARRLEEKMRRKKALKMRRSGARVLGQGSEGMDVDRGLGDDGEGSGEGMLGQMELPIRGLGQ